MYQNIIFQFLFFWKYWQFDYSIIQIHFLHKMIKKFSWISFDLRNNYTKLVCVLKYDLKSFIVFDLSLDWLFFSHLLKPTSFCFLFSLASITCIKKTIVKRCNDFNKYKATKYVNMIQTKEKFTLFLSFKVACALKLKLHSKHKWNETWIDQLQAVCSMIIKPDRKNWYMCDYAHRRIIVAF